MTDAVIKEFKDGIEIWRMNHVETRNAITNRQMIDTLVLYAEQAQQNTQVRVIILTGNGSAFSSGGNIKEIRAQMTESDKTPHELATWYREGIQRIPLAFEKLDVPIIAAVNGPAIGAGCDLTCMCDMRIAAQSARFAESFVKLGIIPGDGGAWLLPRAVGLAKAAEMAFTGDPISAQEALACGLVSKVVADDQLMDEARALAKRVAVNPPISVRMAKQLMREGQKTGLDTHLQMAAVMQAVSHRTKDHKEAMDAIFEKRDADFKGC
ncbi:MAG TPA: crotonase/enoyl-CoA hydratase family protein [Cycloclasticus sp.]|nr:crotonase/enoyl-CoA hydratase family protein [Cycloclasticus sp.]HIL92294.1 crotonase/enoyl-CoA hydratase family protein [Cycloclasticus sp.]